MNTSTILKKILSVKAEEVKERSEKLSLEALKQQVPNSPECRGFKKALEYQFAKGEAGVIAEIKKASPSRGVIRPDFHPVELAKSYEKGGATCLSVLTDVSFFQGCDAYLQKAKKACRLPVLRKDFTISPWQIYESRVLGADCVLLIVAALEKNQLEALYHLSVDIGLDVLVEVHNKEELLLALPLKNALLGINNRNLHTFETTLQTTWDLLPLIPDNRLVVTESGISSRSDIQAMFDHNVKTFLIGESFMRVKNPGDKIKEFFGK